MQSSDDIGYIQTFISYVNGGQGANGGPTFSGNQQGISWSWWVINPVCNYGVRGGEGSGEENIRMVDVIFVNSTHFFTVGHWIQ